jgi:DNA phosphorothioation-associated DGQHR protein 1
MSNQLSFPIKVSALRIEQPLGVFYAAKLSAKLLLEITYSDPLRVTSESTSEAAYPLTGSQREESKIKLREIGRFIDTAEAAFPNSIILGANYRESGELEDNPDFRWRVESEDEGNCIQLIIPSATKLAAIIDGQHRLHGFDHANPEKKSMELLCAIYLDLPNPYQAYLFATINFNQKKVDRSLAYLLFGFNLEQEPAESWSPEKTAVFLCRKLNTDEQSPFYQHIKVAAKDDEKLFGEKAADDSWAVSTATVVDGILRLFSSNPKKDRDLMHKKLIAEGRTRSSLDDDSSPFRTLYKQTNDKAIYIAIKNYFLAVKQVFWLHAPEKSYIKKTVGIQALFDVLNSLLKKYFEDTKNISTDFFKAHLEKAKDIDFSTEKFQASGIGRSLVRRTIEERIGLKSN